MDPDRPQRHRARRTTATGAQRHRRPGPRARGGPARPGVDGRGATLADGRRRPAPLADPGHDTTAPTSTGSPAPSASLFALGADGTDEVRRAARVDLATDDGWPQTDPGPAPLPAGAPASTTPRSARRACCSAALWAEPARARPGADPVAEHAVDRAPGRGRALPSRHRAGGSCRSASHDRARRAGRCRTGRTALAGIAAAARRRRCRAGPTRPGRRRGAAEPSTW